MSDPDIRMRISAALKGKEKSEETKRKMSLAQMGNKKGCHPCSDEKKIKLSLSNMGKKRSDETRKRIGLASRGNRYRLGSFHDEATRKKMSEARIGWKDSAQTIRNKSISACEACINGRKPGKYVYNGIGMRSSWEVVVAKWLDDMNVGWKYECDYFETSVGYYVPDFKLENGSYIEVGNWYTKTLSPEKITKLFEFSKSNDLFFIDNIKLICPKRWGK